MHREKQWTQFAETRRLWDRRVLKSVTPFSSQSVTRHKASKASGARAPFHFQANKRQRNFASPPTDTHYVHEHIRTRCSLCGPGPKRFAAFKGFCVWPRETRHRNGNTARISPPSLLLSIRETSRCSRKRTFFPSHVFVSLSVTFPLCSSRSLNRSRAIFAGD